MIPFGLRLTLRGGKEAASRLTITATAVALGVGLLLATLAAINGVHAQNDRYAWLNSGFPGTTAPDAKPSPDPLWGTLRNDFYDGESITRVDLAATGPESPVPPGIAQLPEPGEFYASPALGALLEDTPAGRLADRYPGTQTGTIGPSALPGPDSLVIVVGRASDDLAHAPGAVKISSIATQSPSSCTNCYSGIDSDSMSLILSVTAAALLLPLLIFIGTATRLSAARREQRFASMRLVGATPRQVSVVAAVESAVAASAGTVAGFALFLLLRAPLAGVSLTGEAFFTSDLTLSPADVALVALGVPLAAAIAAGVALRRVRISPLGVARRTTPRPPRAWRVIPLLLGIAELAYFIGRRPESTGGQIQAYLSGIFLMMIGLMIAGPWLTMAGSRLLARRTSRPAALIAARRLSDNPKAGFRAVSGLVLALFVTSTAIGIMTTMVAERGAPSSAADSDTLITDFRLNPAQSGAPEGTVARVPDAALAELRSLSGVQGVAVIRSNPLGTQVPIGDRQMEAGLVSCAEFAGLPDYGRCEPGAGTASVPPNFAAFDQSESAWKSRTWAAADVSAASLRDLPAQGIVVGTDGSQPVIEEARVALAAAFPDQLTPTTITEDKAHSGGGAELAGYQQLVNVVVLVSLCIAGCSLAVSAVAGLNDRKRPFSQLRLTGARLPMLRRIVTLESVLPLLIAAVVAAATGFLAAALFLRSQLDYALRAPGGGYYLTVLAGLAVSLGVIACTLPVLRRITGPETVRNE